MKSRVVVLAAAVTIASVGMAQARDQIRIVGSSTVYPFTTTVAENFGKTTGFKTPVVESTGTGGGFKLFCEGVGVNTPDITNASRAIKQSELDNCKKAGVENVTEVKVGYDGIVLANSKAAKPVDMSQEQIFLALAKCVPGDGSGQGACPPGFKTNPYKSWSDIDDSLPDYKIEVLGPPPTSGTRDAFLELVMEVGCDELDAIKTIEDEDTKKAVCHGIREDGAYIDAGENDVLIVRKLEANPQAFGIFGFSFLEQNADKVQGAQVAGVAPSYDAIASGEYPVSRPLFIYVKGAHAGVVPGIKEFLAEYTSEGAWGPYGYLADKGLIAMPDEEREKYREDAINLENNVSM
ncbi:MAG: PstS family phosphate ABC transporter substrate-binding protein [Hyphomicrobium sp.]